MKIKSIKWKIVLWFVSTSVIGLAILSLFVYFGISNTVGQMIDQNSAEIIQGRALEIREWLNKNLKAAEMLAHTQTVKNMDFDVLPAYLKEREEAMGRDFTTLFIIDETGYSRTAEGAEYNLSERDYFKAIMSGSDHVISNPIISKATGLAAVVIAYAIKDNSGKTIGLAGGTITLSNLSSIAESVKLGNTDTGLS